jgi:glutathione synthase/RimK-type ligase-like ATP-grasp enzyme
MSPSRVAGARPRVALAASPQYPDLFEEGPLMLHALDDVGLDARTAVWSDPAEDWSAFDLVVANGAWDNIHHPAAFLAWADRVAAAGVAVVNPPATLRWNLDKRYLRDLETEGVPTVPTQWVEAGRGLFEPSTLALLPGEIVVKPSVSGGGYRTARYEPHEHEAARAHVAELIGLGRTAMIQPYQPAVDAAGEVGLIFLGGNFSHAIHKAPMIRRGVGAVDSLIDNQVVNGATATPAQLEVGRQAVAAAERLVGPTTYARVDIVERADGATAVLELELLDPVLFFVEAPEEAATFAGVLRETITRLA